MILRLYAKGVNNLDDSLQQLTSIVKKLESIASTISSDDSVQQLTSIGGSIASIIAIPLAIYLYLKGQAQKHTEVRKDIVKRLSHQIGEERTIHVFELNAIIDSLVREKRLKAGSITSNSVIEDLVAETVSSPLLESAKKESLVKELSKMHSLGHFCSIYEDEVVFNKFIEYLKQGNDIEIDRAENIQKEFKTAKEKTNEPPKIPEVFGAIASLVTIIATVFTFANFTEKLNLIPKLFDSSIITSLAIGLTVSIFAGLITVLISRKHSSE